MLQGEVGDGDDDHQLEEREEEAHQAAHAEQALQALRAASRSGFGTSGLPVIWNPTWKHTEAKVDHEEDAHEGQGPG